MQWSAIVSSIGGKTWGKALQLLSGCAGLIGVIYGLQVLMIERAEVAVCSAEALTAVGEQSFLRQQELTVEVGGAVVKPGVWQLPVGSRVAEALEKAGGFSSRADRTFATHGLNLAQPLTDAQKIYVPFTGELENSTRAKTESETHSASTNPGIGAAATTGAAPTNTNISINTASEKELQELPGIGEARAAKIVENRPYSTLSELVSKGAVGETLFKNIEALIGL